MHLLAVVCALLLGSLSSSSANFTESIDGRIYGGSAARLGQFPFQANLQITTKDGTYKCGGSLISDQWVLTAAHCTQGARSIRVRLGAIQSNSNSGQSFESKEHIEHVRYDGVNIVNDISLIKLPTKATLNSNVNTIRLPKKSQAAVTTFEGKIGIISGWGRTSNRVSSSVNSLQFASAHVMSHSACRRYYARYKLGNGEICTNNAASRSGTCQGDSGGPLFINENNQRILIGITSWGVNFCESSAPSVYTNVAAYLGFINYRTGIPIS